MNVRQQLADWALSWAYGAEHTHSLEFRLGRLAAREITAINRLFAQLKVNAEVDPRGVVASDTGNFIRYPVLSTGKIRNIESVEKDLGVLLTAMRGVDVTVNVRLPSLIIELPFPFEGQRLEWAHAKLSTLRPFQMLVGMDYTRRDPMPALIDFGQKNIAHFLVSGTTGSGKTTLLAAMLLSLCRVTSCEEAQIIFLDPKCDEDWTALAGLPHVTLYSDLEDCVRAVRAVHTELNRRRREPDRRKIFLVMDEYADLISGITDKAVADEVQTMIARIAQIGRSKNIHMGLCTQKPTVDVLDTIAKGNVNTRLGGQVTTPEESRVAMGRSDVGCEDLPGKGAFYLILAGGTVQRIQGYFLSAEEMQAEVDQVVAYSQQRTPYTIDLDPPTEGQAAPTKSEAERIAETILARFRYADLYDEAGKIRHGMQTKAILVNYPDAVANEGEPRRKTVAALKIIKQRYVDGELPGSDEHDAQGEIQ